MDVANDDSVLAPKAVEFPAFEKAFSPDALANGDSFEGFPNEVSAAGFPNGLSVAGLPKGEAFAGLPKGESFVGFPKGESLAGLPNDDSPEGLEKGDSPGFAAAANPLSALPPPAPPAKELNPPVLLPDPEPRRDFPGLLGCPNVDPDVPKPDAPNFGWLGVFV